MLHAGLLDEREGATDAHIRQMQALKRELMSTFEMLDCVPSQAVPIEKATGKNTRPRVRRRLQARGL